MNGTPLAGLKIFNLQCIWHLHHSKRATFDDDPFDVSWIQAVFSRSDWVTKQSEAKLN